MASSLLLSSSSSSSLRLRLIACSILRSPNFNYYGGARMMMSTTTTTTVNSPPWLMLPPAFEGGTVNYYKFYSLAHNEVISLLNSCAAADDDKQVPITLNDETTELVGSSHGWLALFNRTNCDLYLSNPITRRHLKLPPIHNLPIRQENLRGGYGCVSKVIIDDNDEDCRAMMIFNTMDTLAFCCPGRSTTEWTPIGALRRRPDSDVARPYEDVVYSSKHKLFFCLTEIDSNDLECWDIRDPHSPRLRWSNQDDLLGARNYLAWLDQAEESLLHNTGLWCWPLRYLVFSEQSDQLFLVTRHLVEQMTPDGSALEEDDDSTSYPYKTVSFDVHKIDWEEGGGGKLSYVEGGSLDGLAMFVGVNHSFAMSAAEFPQVLKPNSIYFTDDRQVTPLRWRDRKYGGHDIGIFDYENKTISPCYYPCDVQSFKRIMPAPIWFTPTPHN